MERQLTDYTYCLQLIPTQRKYLKSLKKLSALQVEQRFNLIIIC